MLVLPRFLWRCLYEAKKLKRGRQSVNLFVSTVFTDHWWRLGLVVARWSLDQRSYSTPGPVSTEMGDVFGRVNHLRLWPATQANLAFYPQRDGKWVPAKVRWRSAAEEQRQIWSIPFVDKRVDEVKLCDPSLTRAILQRLRGELLMKKRYTNRHFTLIYWSR